VPFFVHRSCARVFHISTRYFLLYFVAFVYMRGSKNKGRGGGWTGSRERLPDDMLDEVDKFHKDADSESLDDALNEYDEEDAVEGALDFEDSEPDSDEDVKAGGKLAKSALVPLSSPCRCNATCGHDIDASRTT
jgi:hypothetical protein